MSKIIKYEMMILVTEKFNDNDLKTWAFNYAKILRKLNVFEIFVILRGKRELSYNILDQKCGNFIQINFSSIPKPVENFSSSLKLDSNVLRFLILNKTNTARKKVQK